jgi:hypothetical protein
MSPAADLTKTVLQMEGEPAGQGGSTTTDDETRLKCVEPLMALLQCLEAKPSGDHTTQLRQIHSVAYALQLVEAVIRRTSSCPNGKAAHQDVKAGYDFTISVSFAAALTAQSFIRKAKPAVLGSLQGQQLMQSCTSLLLTRSSLLQHSGTAETQASLALCLQLLQSLLRSEPLAAAGGMGSGICMSQSLAAGLVLAGRCLMAVASAICPGSSSGLSTQQLVQKQASDLKKWLGNLWVQPPDGSVADIHHSQKDALMRQNAWILHRVVHDLAGCVQYIYQLLQQQAAQPLLGQWATAGSAGAASAAPDSPAPPGQARSSSSSSRTRSSISRPWGIPATVGVIKSEKPFGREPQYQTPADWLLVGMDEAQSALKAVLAPLRGIGNAVLAPYLPQQIDPLPVSTHVILSLPTALVAAGEVLCAAVPSSSCCSNPRCNNLGGVSAGSALVRGKGCVCGGCLGLQAGGFVPCQGVPVAAR